jgi:hypothetical protein
MGRSVRTLLLGGLAALLVWGTACGAPSAEERGPVVVKERRLSTQDLQTFGGSRFRVTLVMWDHDSIDAALRTGAGATLHPARVVVR